uniref:Kinesin-like protein KIF9 n=1 Tax=Callorhinchus milii TaxID=7868 RepID=V9KPI7_CALMI
MREALYINKSLSFLEQTILALADPRREHAPFRQCKLTHVLKDSIGMNNNTVLVANVYGNAEQIEETLATLRFALRMSCVSIEPAPNIHRDPLITVKNLEQEIQMLKDELTMHDVLTNRGQISYEVLTENQLKDIRSQVCRFLEGTLDEINVVNFRQLREVFAQFKYLLQKQAQEIEDMFRAKYTMIDRTDEVTSPVDEKVEPVVEPEKPLVGEVDGRGFGIGPTPPTTKSRRVRSRRNKDASSTCGKRGSTPSGKDMEPICELKIPHLTRSTRDFHRKEAREAKEAAHKELKEAKEAAHREVKEKDKEKESSHKEGVYKEGRESMYGESEVTSTEPIRSDSIPKLEEVRLGTPPSREIAFEIFKAEKGREISRILKENKVIFNEKKLHMGELTNRINNIKEDIDVTKQSLHSKKGERMLQGEYVSEEGEPVIDEEELNLILQLKTLKQQYRQEWEVLKDLRVEVHYCQRLVEQCRHRLLLEFETWYNEMYLLPPDLRFSPLPEAIRPGMIPASRIASLNEDDKERFQRVQQEILRENPDSVAFYNARMRMQQRHKLKVGSQAQTVRAVKQAGAITRTIKTKPPSAFSLA